jgi:transcription elongation factor GreA
MRQNTPIPFTNEGLLKIKSEREKLLNGRPEAVENLRLAREMGDLSENGYYKAARARLSTLDSRIRHLTRLIHDAVVMTPGNPGIVEIGRTVTVDENGTNRNFYIVGQYESDPSIGKISPASPIGRGLMGKKVGDRITIQVPLGTVTFTVMDIR